MSACPRKHFLAGSAVVDTPANDSLRSQVETIRRDGRRPTPQEGTIKRHAKPMKGRTALTVIFCVAFGSACPEVARCQPQIIGIGPMAPAQDARSQPVVVQLRPGGPVVTLFLTPTPAETPYQPQQMQQVSLPKTYEPPASSDLITTARQFLGSSNPTSFQGIPWCGAFLGLVAQITGHPVPPGYLAAKNWASSGEQLPGPRVGAIAVMAHHVGIVEAMTPRGPLLISGNGHDHKVAENVYNAEHVIAYVALR